MTINDILHETYTALKANKVRTGLTMLGIVIGISSVISMLAIGQGAQNSITDSIQSIGSNLIIIMPGAQKGPGMNISSGRGSAKSLTIEDVEAIENDLIDVKAVSPEISGRYQVTYSGQNTNTQVVGVREDYSMVRNVNIEYGDFISEQNNRSGNRVAVLGPTVIEDLFGADINMDEVIGQTIRINKIDFKIIGITKAKGGTGFGSQDDMIFIPLSSAQRYLSGNKYLTTISVSAISSEATTQLQQDITDLLMDKHRIKENGVVDFNTLNQTDIAETASSVTKMFTMLLGSVAGISLIVGGIGIMNMMLTNVTERTREIGLRKAIGATGKDISLQFLIEAMVLTVFGGIIGIILGILFSYIVSWFGIVQANVSLFSIILAFSVSTIIGLVFCYYPAKRAANMNPIEALRYE